MVTYWKISIYFRYFTPQSPLKIVKVWKRVDILKNLCDGEHTFFFFKWKRNTKSLVQKCYCFPNLLGSQYLFEKLHTTLIVKNSENKIKSGCVEKPSRWRALFF